MLFDYLSMFHNNSRYFIGFMAITSIIRFAVLFFSLISLQAGDVRPFFEGPPRADIEIKYWDEFSLFAMRRAFWVISFYNVLYKKNEECFFNTKQFLSRTKATPLDSAEQTACAVKKLERLADTGHEGALLFLAQLCDTENPWVCKSLEIALDCLQTAAELPNASPESAYRYGSKLLEDKDLAQQTKGLEYIIKALAAGHMKGLEYIIKALAAGHMLAIEMVLAQEDISLIRKVAEQYLDGLITKEGSSGDYLRLLRRLLDLGDKEWAPMVILSTRAQGVKTGEECDVVMQDFFKKIENDALHITGEVYPAICGLFSEDQQFMVHDTLVRYFMHNPTAKHGTFAGFLNYCCKEVQDGRDAAPLRCLHQCLHDARRKQCLSSNDQKRITKSFETLLADETAKSPWKYMYKGSELLLRPDVKTFDKGYQLSLQAWENAEWRDANVPLAGELAHSMLAALSTRIADYDLLIPNKRKPATKKATTKLQSTAQSQKNSLENKKHALREQIIASENVLLPLTVWYEQHKAIEQSNQGSYDDVDFSLLAHIPLDEVYNYMCKMQQGTLRFTLAEYLHSKEHFLAGIEVGMTLGQIDKFFGAGLNVLKRLALRPDASNMDNCFIQLIEVQGAQAILRGLTPHSAYLECLKVYEKSGVALSAQKKVIEFIQAQIAAEKRLEGINREHLDKSTEKDISLWGSRGHREIFSNILEAKRMSIEQALAKELSFASETPRT